jgi:hypothetical protein
MTKQPYEITAEDKAEFLGLIRAGHKANTAAKELGTTGTQFRHLKSKQSQYYDADFARAWREAEASDEHHRNRQEALRAQIDERSLTSDAILVKRALIELPEWEPLRHQNFRHDIDINLVAQILPSIPLEVIEQAIEAEEAKLGAKPIHLLPPAKEDTP